MRHLNSLVLCSLVLSSTLFTSTVLTTRSVHAETFGNEAYALLKSIYSYDATYPLNARVVGNTRHGDHVFEKLVFDSFHNGKVTGLLGLPENSNPQTPAPVVLLLHGVTSSKSDWLNGTFINGEKVTQGLLSRGFAVLALDAQYHGERAVYNDYVNAGEMVFQRQWGVRYANMLTQSVVDYRRAIDYLATRPEIDTTRLGLMGYSMGGHMAFMLGAVEPRIAATVACVVPHMGPMPMAPTQFARDMGDDPLLMLMASQDRFYTSEQALALYDSVPGTDKAL
jgi:dienelactone hydrolase